MQNNYKVSYNFKCLNRRSNDYGVVKFDSMRSFKTFNQAQEFARKLLNNQFDTMQCVGIPTINLPEENYDA